MIRILQISDIHFHPLGEETMNYAQLRTVFLDDVKDCATAQGSRIDYILVCGDLAFDGSKEDFEAAGKFMKELHQRTGCDEKNSYLVPGNHDKQLDCYKETRSWVREALLKEIQGHVLEKKMIVSEPITWSTLYRPFAAYSDFSIPYDSLSEMMAATANNEVTEDLSQLKMFWQTDLMKINGLTISLYGLNSSLVSDWEDKNHNQYLPQSAYAEITQGKSKVNILLMHHPLSVIKDGEHIQAELDERFRVQLYGHMHSQSSESNENNAVRIYSGALQPPKEDGYFPVYNVIDLDVEDNGNGHKTLKVNVHSRIWKNGRFVKFEEETKAYKLDIDVSNNWEPVKEEATKNIVPMSAELRKEYLMRSDKRIIMNEMMPDRFDGEPLSLAYLKFLKAVEADGRINELKSKMK